MNAPVEGAPPVRVTPSALREVIGLGLGKPAVKDAAASGELFSSLLDRVLVAHVPLIPRLEMTRARLAEQRALTALRRRQMRTAAVELEAARSIAEGLAADSVESMVALAFRLAVEAYGCYVRRDFAGAIACIEDAAETSTHLLSRTEDPVFLAHLLQLHHNLARVLIGRGDLRPGIERISEIRTACLCRDGSALDLPREPALDGVPAALLDAMAEQVIVDAIRCARSADPAQATWIRSILSRGDACRWIGADGWCGLQRGLIDGSPLDALDPRALAWIARGPGGRPELFFDAMVMLERRWLGDADLQVRIAAHPGALLSRPGLQRDSDHSAVSSGLPHAG